MYHARPRCADHLAGHATLPSFPTLHCAGSQWLTHKMELQGQGPEKGQVTLMSLVILRPKKVATNQGMPGLPDPHLWWGTHVLAHGWLILSLAKGLALLQELWGLGRSVHTTGTPGGKTFLQRDPCAITRNLPSPAHPKGGLHHSEYTQQPKLPLHSVFHATVPESSL